MFLWAVEGMHFSIANNRNSRNHWAVPDRVPSFPNRWGAAVQLFKNERVLKCLSGLANGQLYVSTTGRFSAEKIVQVVSISSASLADLSDGSRVLTVQHSGPARLTGFTPRFRGTENQSCGFTRSYANSTTIPLYGVVGRANYDTGSIQLACGASIPSGGSPILSEMRWFLVPLDCSLMMPAVRFVPKEISRARRAAANLARLDSIPELA